MDRFAFLCFWFYLEKGGKGFLGTFKARVSMCLILSFELNMLRAFLPPGNHFVNQSNIFFLFSGNDNQSWHGSGAKNVLEKNWACLLSYLYC